MKTGDVRQIRWQLVCINSRQVGHDLLQEMQYELPHYNLEGLMYMFETTLRARTRYENYIRSYEHRNRNEG